MAETPPPISLFFSYAHKDETLRDELSKHLSTLERHGVISAWHDRSIKPGDDWAKEIAVQIEQARIILLLVSSDFLDSEYCYDVELKAALNRHESGESVVIPIILRDCDWSGEAYGALQALPKNAKPVTSWKNQDKAFTDVAKGIRAAATSLRAKLAAASDPKLQPEPSPMPRPRIAGIKPSEEFELREPAPSHRARLDLEGFGEELLRREVAEFKVANPYLLGDAFVGRETELADLGEWLRADDDRMLCICDLGGTGKSALVWRWLNDKATRETLEQRRIKQYWCSFYARSFDSVQFLLDLAALFGGATIVEASPWRAQERLRRFVLDRLKTERWLLVLDGLEREMGAFVNPEHFQVDSEEQDRRNEAKQVPVEEKYIRSPMFAQFLREILDTGTKVLITTRIFPENLNAGDRPLPGVREYPFHPMPEADAIRVWNASGEADDSPLQRQFFESVRCHPQVISVVAAAVKEERMLRFTEWFEDFDEAERRGCLDAETLTARRHRWLELSVRDLVRNRRDEWLTLCYIVRRSEASAVESLMKSLVDEADADRRQAGRFRSGDKLIEVLQYLAMRRLIGVDFTRGLVDVHPVIRGLVMDYILKQYQAGASGDVEVMRHLESGEDSRDLLLRFLNQPDLEQQFESLSNVLDQFRDIPAGPQAALGILAKFYPDAAAADGRPWQSALPALRLRKDQAWVMRRTAHELMTRGRWEESGALIRRAEIAFQLCGDLQSVEDCRHSHDWQSLYGGTLRQAEAHQLDALEQGGSERAESAQYWLALLLAIRQSEQHAAELLRSLPSGTDRWTMQTVAEAWLYLDDDETAATLAQQAWDRRETEHDVMAQALWEAVTIGLARGRMGQNAEAGFYLDFALRHGVGWSYNLVPMFALAGRIELHYHEGMKTRRLRDRQEQFAQADLVHKQYCKLDPTDQFQIPASEAHLAMALVERERSNLAEAGTLARRALTIARGETPPFHYASAVRRATNFLTDVLQEPPAPVGPIGWEALEHEDRLRRWMIARR